MKKQIKTILAVLTLVAFTVNVCFASDVGVPAASHSTITKESCNISSNEFTVASAPAEIKHFEIHKVSFLSFNKHVSVFPVLPLCCKHNSIKPTKAWC